PLRDDALQPERLRLREQRGAVPGHVVGVTQRTAHRDDRAQQSFAFHERQRPDVVWACREQIEQVKGRGQLERGAPDVRRTLQPRALLQALEARQSGIVVYDDLAVDDQPFVWQP